MKKLIAVTLAVTILFTSSAAILGEGAASGNPSSGAAARFQNALRNCTEEMEQSQVDFDALQARIAEKRAQMEEKKASFETKREEYRAFRTILQSKRIEMLGLRKTSNRLHSENAKLMGDLRSSLMTMEEKDIVLSEEDQLALDGFRASIRDLTANIRETKGQIHEILVENRQNILNKDYVAMELAFDEIYAIQQYRNDSLTQINTLMQEIIQLLVAEV